MDPLPFVRSIAPPSFVRSVLFLHLEYDAVVVVLAVAVVAVVAADAAEADAALQSGARWFILSFVSWPAIADHETKQYDHPIL